MAVSSDPLSEPLQMVHNSCLIMVPLTGWHSVSVPATPHSRVVSFKDGREVVAQDVVERSLLLKSILSATSSKEKATVDLPRATFQFWVQSAVRPPTTQKLTDSSLISLIQAADYLKDEVGLQTAAQLLAKSLQRRVIDIIWRQSMLECLTEEQCGRVLRAVPVRNLHFFPANFQRQGLMAHYGSVQTDKALVEKVTDPKTTQQISSCLGSLTMLTSISFRPWLDDQATREAFQAIQTMRRLAALNLSDMHLTAQTCEALHDSLKIMTQLEALNLTNCGLTDKTIATLLPAVCGIPGLLELYLRDNELYFEGAQHLFENFSELKKLKRLDIAHTFFDCALISENPDFLGDDEEVEPAAWRHKLIVPMFIELRSLAWLDISGHLDGDVITKLAIMKVLKELPHFKELVSNAASLIQFAGHAPEFIAATDEVLEACGLQATLSGPDFLPELRLNIATESEAALLEGHEGNLYDMTHPQGDRSPAFNAPHVSSLVLSVQKVHSQGELLAAELSALTQIKAFHLECVVSAMPPDGSLHAEAPESGAAAPPTSLTNTGPSGEELLPFAGMLSCFTNLTELHWEHHPRQQDTCAYAAALAKSLKQLVHLKALSINADFPVDEEAAMLSSSIALLTALTRLEISHPTTALLAACAPSLPALCLQHVTLDTRDEGYSGTWNREPIVSEFACNVLHLNQLTSLQIRAFNLSCADVAALSLVLHLNTALVAINLALMGTTRQLAFQESREEFTKSERGVLSELCAALRALPLQKMTLELDFWMPETEELLFRPVDSGLNPDPCWTALSSFEGVVVTPWPEPENKHVRADTLIRALAAAENLEELTLQRCHIEDHTFEKPMLQSFFPRLKQLSLTASMSTLAAKRFGQALGGTSMPCLERLELIIFHESWAEVDWFGFSHPSSHPSSHREVGENPWQFRGNAVDACLRTLLHGMRDMQLPSLRHLTLKASTRRIKASKPLHGPHAHLDHAQESYMFGGSLVACLRRCSRLQSLSIGTLDIGQESLEYLSPCIGTMHALTSLQLSGAEIDKTGATALLRYASKHTGLRELSLYSCWIHDECLAPQNDKTKAPQGPFSEWLRSLPALHVLEIDDIDTGPKGQELLARTGATLERVHPLEISRCTTNDYFAAPEAKLEPVAEDQPLQEHEALEEHEHSEHVNMKITPEELAALEEEDEEDGVMLDAEIVPGIAELQELADLEEVPPELEGEQLPVQGPQVQNPDP